MKDKEPPLLMANQRALGLALEAGYEIDPVTLTAYRHEHDDWPAGTHAAREMPNRPTILYGTPPLPQTRGSDEPYLLATSAVAKSAKPCGDKRRRKGLAGIQPLTQRQLGRVSFERDHSNVKPSPARSGGKMLPVAAIPQCPEPARAPTRPPGHAALQCERQVENKLSFYKEDSTIEARLEKTYVRKAVQKPDKLLGADFHNVHTADSLREHWRQEKRFSFNPNNFVEEERLTESYVESHADRPRKVPINRLY